MIPLSRPSINGKEISAVKKVLLSGWLAHGPMNEEFERVFTDYIGAKYAVSLNSGTSALFLSLIGHGITGEVILPSFTFVASANSIVSAGAKPVFAEIDSLTFNIDPDDIKKRISRRIQALMIVHYAGQSCRMDKIMQIVDKYGLILIEDSAETIGGKFKNRLAGSFGTGCFSFFPTKNITTGEGGMVTTNNLRLARKIKAYASHGIYSTTLERTRKVKPWLRDAALAGYNFRLSNILAAIGVEQMKKIDELNNSRRGHAVYLNKGLRDTFEIITPKEDKDCFHVYQMYVIRLKNNIDRTKFILELRNNGVGASVHFDPPVHLHKYYRKQFGFKKGDFPVTEKIAQTVVTLPLYPELKKEELNRIIFFVKKAVSMARRKR